MDISKVRKKLRKLESDERVKKPSSDDTGETGNAAVEEKPVEPQEPNNVKQEDTGTSVAGPIPSDEEEIRVEDFELIAFNVSNEEFAIKLSEMQEIIRQRVVTPVPRSPKYLEGVTFLRGKVLPVINIAERLSLNRTDMDRQKIIVILASKGPVGVFARKIIDVIRISETELLPPPATLNDKERSFMSGVIKKGERFISVLNINKLAEMEKK